MKAFESYRVSGRYGSCRIRRILQPRSRQRKGKSTDRTKARRPTRPRHDGSNRMCDQRHQTDRGAGGYPDGGCRAENFGTAGTSGLDDGTPAGEGLAVTNQQVIAVIDHRDIRAQLARAKAAVEAARTAVATANVVLKDRDRERKRMEKLFAEGSTTEQQRDPAVTAHEQAITGARAGLRGEPGRACADCRRRDRSDADRSLSSCPIGWRRQREIH